MDKLLQPGDEVHYVQLANGAVVVSAQLMDKFEKEYPSKKVGTIFGGVEVRVSKHLPYIHTDHEAECANCGHRKISHSALSGCVACTGDDWCDTFVNTEGVL